MRRTPNTMPAFAAAALLALAGCGTGPIKVPEDASSVTGGLGLRLWHAKTDTRQYEYFTVDPNGTLGYGGGMKGFDRLVDWTGPLTKDEAARLREIVMAAHWLDAESPGREGKDPVRTEVCVLNGSAERSFAISGPDEAVNRTVELLSKAAQRRFDRFMQRLPEAGVQAR